MNTYTVPKMTPRGLPPGPGLLIVEMEDDTEENPNEPPTAVWRAVNGEWKLVSLVRPDGTLEPLPPNPPSVNS